MSISIVERSALCDRGEAIRIIGGSMAAKTGKVKPGAKSQASSTPPRRRRFVRAIISLWRPLPLVAISLSLALIVFWPEITCQIPDLSQREEYRFDWDAVQVTPSGSWVPANLVEQVREQSNLAESVSLLDAGLVRSLAAAFEQHAWVKSVRSVVKHPHGVSVDVEYRQPVLMVQTQRGIYPVDDEGVLLPPADFTAADVELFPRLEHVRSIPQARAGVAWGDNTVHGAARLAARLLQGDDHESPWSRYRLQAIVARTQRGPVAAVDDVVFRLETASGSQIVWGHAPGADALEPTIEQKLERLEKFLADHGEFTHLSQPVIIDITDWEVIRWDLLSRVPRESVVR